jgi:hypothetical protein
MVMHSLAAVVALVAAKGWTAGLPAVSVDGKWVAVAASVSDGARGAENLALEIYDVDDDRRVERLVVVDPEDPEAAGREGREARAAAALAKRAWRPLRALDVAEDPGAPVRRGGVGGPERASVAFGDGLRVTYREPVLVVRDGRREAYRRSVRGFSKPGGPRCPGCEDCPAPLAGLSRAYVDRASRVLLLDISYAGGTDVCWEPDETFHVVRLGRMEPRASSAYRSVSPP